MVDPERALEETKLQLAQANARITELESQLSQLWTLHEPFCRKTDETLENGQTVTTASKADDMLRLLQASVQQSEDAIIIADSQHNVVFANPAYTKITGYLPTEAIGKKSFFFADVQDDLGPADQVESASPALLPLSGEMKIQHKSGRLHYVACSTAPILDKGEKATHYVTVMRDISQRKQHELLQMQLSYVLESIVGNQPLLRILDQLVRIIEEYYPHIRSSVLILDAKTHQLRYGAAPNLPEAYNKAIDGIVIGPRAGSCGTAAYEKRMVIVEDIETDPLWADFRHLAREYGLRACWSKPIFSPAGTVLGTFALYYQQPRSPNVDELELLRMVTHIAEIAMRHKQEQELLRNSEAQQRAILAAIPDPLFRIKSDGTLIDYHAPSPQMLMLPPEAFLGKKVQDVLPPRATQLILKTVEQVIQAKKPTSIEYSASQQGKLREFEARFVPFADDEAIVFIRDVTERKHAEIALKAAHASLEQRVIERTAELEQTQKRLEAIFNHSADGIVLLDLQQGIQQANYTFEKLFARLPETYLGRQLTEFFHPEENRQLEALITEIYSTYEPRRIETRAKRSDGSYFAAEMSVAPINESPTTTPKLVCIIRDVSVRKTAELALAQKHQEELEMQQYLKALHQIGIELAGIDSLDEFYKRTVELALQALGIERFSLFCYDPERNMALGTYGTGIAGDLRAEYHIQFVVNPWGGMYESLSNTNRLYFEEDADLKYDQAHVGKGWNAIVALWYGEQNLGWLCADNLLTHQPATKPLLEALVQYGALIASTLGRKLAANALEEKHQQELAMQKYLKALHGIGIELERTETLDQFYQQTVVLGQDRFGFERMQLLLYDAASHAVLGAYQIKSNGEVVDERHLRFKLAELPPIYQEIVANQAQLEVDTDARLHSEMDSKNLVSKAVATIWDDELLGWLVVDSIDSRKTISKPQLDIFMLYSMTVAALLTRRRIQEKLASVSHRLKLATHSSGIAIWEWDLKKNLFYCDDQMYELHGLPKKGEDQPDDLNTFVYTIHPDDAPAVAECTRDSIVNGKPYDITYRIVRPDREVRYIRANGTFLLNETGEHERMVGANWDITQIARSEEALRQALDKEKELGELKSRFVSTASHEFRTPLTSILAVAETLLAYRRKLSDQQIDLKLTKIREQVEYLKGIMDDVLQLSRLQARRFELNPIWLDLHELCLNVIEEFEQRKDFAHHLQFIDDPSLGEVCLDKRLMRQIVNNLLSNAIKYSSPHTTITVQLEKIDNKLLFKVTDQGIGIPEADMSHLFEPFHRAANVGNVSGTGLGLVIIKESVELQGGTVRVNSQEGVGTTFTISLPVGNK